MISLTSFALPRDTVLCPGDTLKLGGSPHFFHYWWSNGDTGHIAAITQPGTYWCAADYGCANATDTIRVLEPNPLHAVHDSLRVCDSTVGGVPYYPDTVGYNAGVRYQWSHGPTTAAAMLPAGGRYLLRKYDSCAEAVDTVDIASCRPA